jgi:hypothetical protein
MFFALATVAGQAQTVDKLQDVRAIYVVHFTGQSPEIADLISAKLISYLSKQPGVTVVTDEGEADAVLTGSGRIDQTGYLNGNPEYRATLAARLEGKGGVVLWADDVTSSPYARSVTSSVCERTATRLSQALSGKKPGWRERIEEGRERAGGDK